MCKIRIKSSKIFLKCGCGASGRMENNCDILEKVDAITGFIGFVGTQKATIVERIGHSCQALNQRSKIIPTQDILGEETLPTLFPPFPPLFPIFFLF